MSDNWYDIEVPAGSAEGSIVAMLVAGRELVAIHHGGAWQVFADMCTLAQCRFSEFGEVDASDGIIICACHGAEFSVDTGEVLLEPAEEPIELLAVREVDGRVQIRLDPARARQPGRSLTPSCRRTSAPSATCPSRVTTARSDLGADLGSGRHLCARMRGRFGHERDPSALATRPTIVRV